MSVIEEKRAPGYLFRELRTKEGKGEVRDALRKNFDSGTFSVVFTAGRFVNHISLNSFIAVAACGRVGSELSGHNIATPIGKMCRKCVKIYREAFIEWVQEREIKAVSEMDKDTLEAISNTRKMMAEDKDWHKGLAEITI